MPFGDIGGNATSIKGIKSMQKKKKNCIKIYKYYKNNNNKQQQQNQVSLFGASNTGNHLLSWSFLGVVSWLKWRNDFFGYIISGYICYSKASSLHLKSDHQIKCIFCYMQSQIKLKSKQPLQAKKAKGREPICFCSMRWLDVQVPPGTTSIRHVTRACDMLACHRDLLIPIH